jgi:hypothetical protein
MKLIATGCLLLGALCIASAQVTPIGPKKGGYILDFSASYDKPQNNDASTQFSISPMFFVTDNIGLGVQVDWFHQNGYDDTFLGVEGRYYFNGMGNNLFKPFVGAAYGIDHTTGFGDTTTWELRAGAHYFVANNVAITGMLEWEQNRFSGVNETDFNIGFGFTIFFPGKG